jgi:hypothetical protein
LTKRATIPVFFKGYEPTYPVAVETVGIDTGSLMRSNLLSLNPSLYMQAKSAFQMWMRVLRG